MKFAVLGLTTQVELPSTLELSPMLTASTRPPVTLESHWQEWLGTTRAERFSTAPLFLLATALSKRPQILDDENKALHERLWQVLAGLLLAGRAVFGSPTVLLGAYTEERLSVRSVIEHKPVHPILGVHSEPITEDGLRQAWRIAEAIERWNAVGPAWRISRVMSIFVETRSAREIPERIHQFSRCVEGFILPNQGNTKKQFKSRTELFVGPGNHDLMGSIYDIRSSVEHLHYQRLGEMAGRNERLRIARQAAIMEALARHCIVRLLSRNSLWPHFKVNDTLEAFWTLPRSEQQSLWGSPVSVTDLINGFDENFISNADLGLE